MRKIDKKIVAIVAIAFLIGILVSKILFSGVGNGKETPLEDKHDEVWTCAMHPQIKLPDPGDCPICGMELIPLIADKTDNGVTADFTMSDYSKALAKVEVTTVKLEEPTYSSTFLGEIDWNEKSFQTQSAWFGGRVDKLYISFVGQTVRRGQAIALIYSPELFAAAEEWRQAEGSENNRLIKSVRRKLELLGLGDRDIKNLGSIKSDRFTQRATVSGVVTKMNVADGGYVKAGGAILQVARTNRLWTQIELYEKDLDVVNINDKVTITVPNSFTQVSGKIAFVDPVVDRKKRTTRARVAINNRDGLLKPGMLVEAKITKKLNGKRVLVPATSLLFTGTRAVLYIEVNGGYELREVLVGKKFGEYYAVEGVVEGEKVVSRGAFKIDAARQIMALPSMMYPDGGAPDPMAGMDMGEGSKKTTFANKKSVSKNSSKMDMKSLSSKEKEWINTLYPNYLKMQNSLRDDKTAASITSALNMMKPLMSPPKRFATEEESAVMMSLHKIKKDSDIKDVRAYFYKLSKWMIAILEMNKFTPTGGGSVFFCPMANNNKGAEWIQQESEVLNPYWGEAMIGCGELRRPVGVKGK